MKVLTLKRLEKLNACHEAIVDFKDFFGTKATISKVYHRLQNSESDDAFKERYPGWLSWLLGQEVELTIAFLDEGADMNVVDEEGWTPLHWTTLSNVEVAEFLIKKGIDVNIVDENGRTPLYCAAVRDNTEVVKFLIEKGADVNVVDTYGDTPLYWAEYNKNEEMIELLKAKGAEK